MSEKQRPSITVVPDGPYIVRGLERLRGVEDMQHVQGRTLAFCRCGGSAIKPLCDGTHLKKGFSGKNTADPSKDKRESYAGVAITVHDNRSICSHAGICTDRLASIFRMKEEPWIDPDGATAEEIIATIRQCPSGALSFSMGGVEHREQAAEPSIAVVKGGPYVVVGGAELVGVPRAEGAAERHFTLCRCGESKNKPFCDGTHWNVDFDDKDDKRAQ